MRQPPVEILVKSVAHNLNGPNADEVYDFLASWSVHPSGWATAWRDLNCVAIVSRLCGVIKELKDGQVATAADH